MPLIGFLLCSIAFIALLVRQYFSNRTGFVVALSLILICLIAEWIYKSTESNR